MKTHKITTWNYSEHPNQDAVLEWVRTNWHDIYGWHDENRQSLESFAEWFNCKSDYEISLCSYSYASITSDSEIMELSGIRLWKWLQNNGYFDSDKLSGNCPFTGYSMDETLLDEIRKFRDKPDSRSLSDLLNDCASNWVKGCLADWEYTYSDEGLADFLEANEYEFIESGEFY